MLEEVREYDYASVRSIYLSLFPTFFGSYVKDQCKEGSIEKQKSIYSSSVVRRAFFDLFSHPGACVEHGMERSHHHFYFSAPFVRLSRFQL